MPLNYLCNLGRGDRKGGTQYLHIYTVGVNFSSPWQEIALKSASGWRQ
ncbi:MAG: hypothetical protein F6K39_12185 [Okeania sp. SIO3B3]|nr:hypothetical protein [Okeania sp. SIO3B3]